MHIVKIVENFRLVRSETRKEELQLELFPSSRFLKASLFTRPSRGLEKLDHSHAEAEGRANCQQI